VPPLSYRFLGRVRYAEAWELQRELVAELREGLAGARETLLAVEHEPVITLGRRGRREDVLLGEDALRALGVDLHVVERGGEVTYHGPGQLVLYPIVRVGPGRFGVGDLVRQLAAAIAERLAEEGIAAVYEPERPGLWVDGAKIAAVGMRVARGVSMHGAALNVDVDLRGFSWIVPCGLPEAPVTSMRALLGESHRLAPLEALARDIAVGFAGRLGFELEAPVGGAAD
jgi:lipoyl(octanoyl) transferase